MSKQSDLGFFLSVNAKGKPQKANQAQCGMGQEPERQERESEQAGLGKRADR